MKKDIQKILKESEDCENNSESRKNVMLDFIRGYVTKNGQVKSAELFGMAQSSLSATLNESRYFSERLLRNIVKKITEIENKI
ncbi:MAG: Cro/CI family transcriptional regulator [Leptospiraceae bacterium]|nr:Cro/CI family transcriptional regulator [Leptospiraceae bacterium]